MSRFKVGQRVRVTDGDNHTKALGAIGIETNIVAIPSRHLVSMSQNYDCDVTFNGKDYGAQFWQLSPLTDPACRCLYYSHQEARARASKFSREGDGMTFFQRALITLGGCLMAMAVLLMVVGCAAPTPWPAGQPTSPPQGCEALRDRTSPDEC